MLGQLDHRDVYGMAIYLPLPLTCSRRALMKGLVATLQYYYFVR